MADELQGTVLAPATGTGEQSDGTQVAVATADPAAGGAGAAAVSEFDLSTIDGIRAASEKFPALKDWRENGYGAGKQAGEQELLERLRREEGTLSRAQQYNQDVITRLRAGEDPDAIAKDTPKFVKANEDWVRLGLNRAYIETAAQHFGVAEQETVKGLLVSIDDPSVTADPVTATSRLASQLMEAVHAKGKADALDALTPETLAQHPKFKDFIDAKVAEELETEMTARAIEAKQQPGSPVIPAGTAAEPVTRQTLDAMTPDARRAYFASLTDDQRSAMWTVLMPS